VIPVDDFAPAKPARRRPPKPAPVPAPLPEPAPGGLDLGDADLSSVFSSDDIPDDLGSIPYVVGSKRSDTTPTTLDVPSAPANAPRAKDRDRLEEDDFYDAILKEYAHSPSTAGRLQLSSQYGDSVTRLESFVGNMNSESGEIAVEFGDEEEEAPDNGETPPPASSITIDEEIGDEPEQQSTSLGQLLEGIDDGHDHVEVDDPVDDDEDISPADSIVDFEDLGHDEDPIEADDTIIEAEDLVDDDAPPPHPDDSVVANNSNVDNFVVSQIDDDDPPSHADHTVVANSSNVDNSVVSQIDDDAPPSHADDSVVANSSNVENSLISQIDVLDDSRVINIDDSGIRQTATPDDSSMTEIAAADSDDIVSQANDLMIQVESVAYHEPVETEVQHFGDDFVEDEPKPEPGRVLEQVVIERPRPMLSMQRPYAATITGRNENRIFMQQHQTSFSMPPARMPKADGRQAVLLREPRKLSSASLRDVNACYREAVKSTQFELSLISQSINALLTTKRMREEGRKAEGITLAGVRAEIRHKSRRRRRRATRSESDDE
jgi:hypothetical protein